MPLRRRDVAVAQGAYYGVTAIWPLVSRRTFEAVTGHKDDWWLVETIALLLLPVAGALGAAGRLRREVAASEREVRPLLTEAQATAARAAEVQRPS